MPVQSRARSRARSTIACDECAWSPPLAHAAIAAPAKNCKTFENACKGPAAGGGSGAADSIGEHREVLHPQLANRAAINRLEVWLGEAGARKARHQHFDGEADRRVGHVAADATMRPGAERHDRFRLAV